MSRSTKLSNQRLIRALMASNTITGAARLAGCCKQTVYNRLSDDNFQHEYQDAVDKATESFEGELKAAGVMAFQTLREIAGAPYGVSDDLKVKASATILEFVSKKLVDNQ